MFIKNVISCIESRGSLPNRVYGFFGFLQIFRIFSDFFFNFPDFRDFPEFGVYFIFGGIFVDLCGYFWIFWIFSDISLCKFCF